MAFYGNNFTFDGISSEFYGLHITISNSNDTTSIIELESNLIKPYRQSKFLPFKQYMNKPRILPISLYSETPLTRSQVDKIGQWLFRTDGKFRKLRIEQDDMINFYYNCRLKKLEEETFGNLTYILHCEMECDSIYAWENPQTLTYTINTVPYTAEFLNVSSEDIMKPTYVITCNSNNGTIKIINSKYTEEMFNTMEFVNLYNGEILTIDTEHNIITSNLRTSGLLNLFKTYINFMRLEKGDNIFTITGNISEFKILYQNARIIGG